MKQLLYILVTFLFFASCRPSFENDANQKLYDEVMVIHDEVMPRMSEIHKLKKSIKQQWQDTSKQSYDEAMQLKKELQEADDAMMDWMAEFKMPKEASEEEIRVFLEKEKEKITAVSRSMTKSIENAELFLRQYK